MINSKSVNKIFILILLFIITDTYAQCKSQFVMDVGGGRTITGRIHVPYKVDDCVEIFTNIKPPVFLFDSSWALKDMINTEKNYLFDSRCRRFEKVPEHDTWMNEITEIIDHGNVKALHKLICFHDDKDSAFLVLSTELPLMKNEMLRSYLARDLRLSNNLKAINALISIANDSCEYVRLEVGRSLALLGERTVSFDILKQIWQMKIYPINVDRFDYFTASMRNINTQEAVDFLIMLAADTNQYCALDASICLLQMGKSKEGLKGIRHALITDDPLIFKAATRALFAYFPTSVLVELLHDIEPSKEKEIANFRNCILLNYEGGFNEN